jgi:hypothetical protein
MNDRLAELYKGVAVHATADTEHTAALELLALVMAADNSLTVQEIDTIKEIASEWREQAFTFDKYAGPAIAKAQAAIADGTELDMIDDIDQRSAAHGAVLGRSRGGPRRRRRQPCGGQHPRRGRRPLRLIRRPRRTRRSAARHRP